MNFYTPPSQKPDVQRLGLPRTSILQSLSIIPQCFYNGSRRQKSKFAYAIGDSRRLIELPRADVAVVEAKAVEVGVVVAIVAITGSATTRSRRPTRSSRGTMIALSTCQRRSACSSGRR